MKLKTKLTKKQMLPILIISLVVLITGNAIYKYVVYKPPIQQEEKPTIKGDGEIEDIDYDKFIEVETKEEYINGQRSNLDKWNKAYELHKESITEDLWTNEKAQENFIDVSKGFVNASKLVKNYTWLNGGNSTELLFIESMDYFMDEIQLRIELFELIRNNASNDNDFIISEKLTIADEYNASALKKLIKAQSKFAELDKKKK